MESTGSRSDFQKEDGEEKKLDFFLFNASACVTDNGKAVQRFYISSDLRVECVPAAL